MAKGRPVLVTTVYRGVFFGYLMKPVKDGRVTLRKARNCIYWSADVKGFLGLAATGPTAACRIGPVVPSIELLAVTSISDVTPEAERQWINAVWS